MSWPTDNWGLGGRPRGISHDLFDFCRPPQIGIPLWRQSVGEFGPLNVRNGSEICRRVTSASCPLFTSKRTLIGGVWTSV